MDAAMETITDQPKEGKNNSVIRCYSLEMYKSM